MGHHLLMLLLLIIIAQNRLKEKHRGAGRLFKFGRGGTIIKTGGTDHAGLIERTSTKKHKKDPAEESPNTKSQANGWFQEKQKTKARTSNCVGGSPRCFCPSDKTMDEDAASTHAFSNSAAMLARVRVRASTRV